MSELRIWKDAGDGSMAYLDLELRSGGLVALLAKDAAGHQKACLLYVSKEGIERVPGISSRLGFKMTHDRRIALRDDPITKELLKLKEGRCRHCGH